MTLLSDTSARVQPLHQGAMALARERQDRLTKPQGALGRLEALSVHLAGITSTLAPRLDRKAVVVMAADHGVTAQGVSAYPQEVTAQMVANFIAGGAAINVLARHAGARVIVVDIGVAGPLPPHPDLVSRRVRGGTRDFTEEPAMTRDEAVEAVEAGITLVNGEVARGLDLLALGEMGIGNTTAASALTAVFTGEGPAAVTGRGTGIDEAAWRHKVSVVERALALHQPDPANGIDTLAAVGGLEIAGLAGAAIAGASHHVPVIIDGFISTAAALVATALCPRVREYLIASHRSVEPGHRAALARLGLRPLLDLDLRLGEGTGAVLAFPLIDASLQLLSEMATFDEAGVSERDP